VSGETVSTETTTDGILAAHKSSDVVRRHRGARPSIATVCACGTEFEGAPYQQIEGWIRHLVQVAQDQALALALPSRDALVASIVAARWPDGDTQGFPSRTVAEMIADRIIADAGESS
jgi:hypothetical protein